MDNTYFKSKAVDFWLVRHGQTIENLKRVSQGHNPGMLSELGWEQARLVGNRLKYEKFNFVTVSDLQRARDTWEAITTLQGRRYTEQNGFL